MRAAGSRQLPRIPVTIQTGKLLGFEHGAPLDVHVTARLESVSLQCIDRDQPGDYPCRAVEIASIPDGIEMRSDDDTGSCAIAAGHGDVSVGGGIMIDEETEIARSLRQQAMRSSLLPQARERTNPAPTISSVIATTGMLPVAACTARIAASPPHRIASGLALMRSATVVGN